MQTGSLAIDLNADLGEGYPWDEALLEFVTSANISCGAHANDPEAIRAVLRLARDRRVVIGAHPSYLDRETFGRRERAATAEEVEALIRAQVVDLRAWAGEVGAEVRYLKPHGALYNQAQREEAIARGVAAAARALDLPVLGLPGGCLQALAAASGCRFVPEGFADRRYEPDGRLVPRSRPDAVLDRLADVEAQVVRLARAGVETLCLHGDNPHALEFANVVRAFLARHRIDLRPFITPDR